MRRIILSFILGLLTHISYSQTSHILNFNSTHVIGNTDTTITVAIGDSIVIIHNQDDDDFEVVLNGTDTIGAYNIIYGQPIYELKLLNDTINSIKITYYDPNQYRLINLAYSSVSLNEVNSTKKINIYPNPISRGEYLYLTEIGNFEFSKIYSSSGQEITATDSLNKEFVRADFEPGIYFIELINTKDGIRKLKKIVVK